VRGRRCVLAGRAALVADHTGLGGAVAVDHHHLRQHLARELLRGRRAQRATRRETDQRGEVPAVGVLAHEVDHRAHHRVTHERDEVDLLALHQIERGFGVERSRRAVHDPATGVERREGRPVPAHVHERRCDELGCAVRGNALSDLFRSRDGRRATGIATTERAEEDIFVGPHHTLGHPGGPARVTEIEVVRAAAGEVALGRRRGERDLVVDRVVGHGLTTAVLHHDEVAKRGHVLAHGRDRRPEAPVEHEGDEVGVGEEVLELTFHVAVVHVHGDGSDLVGPEHPFDVLGAVEQLEPDVVAPADAGTSQMVRQAVGALLELGVRHPAFDRGERGAIAVGISDMLEQLRQVVRHRRRG